MSVPKHITIFAKKGAPITIARNIANYSLVLRQIMSDLPKQTSFSFDGSSEHMALVFEYCAHYARSELPAGAKRGDELSRAFLTANTTVRDDAVRERELAGMPPDVRATIPPRPISRAMKQRSEYDYDFCRRLLPPKNHSEIMAHDIVLILDVMRTANYFDVYGLVSVLSQTIADIIKARDNVDDILALLKLERNISPRESVIIMEQDRWAFHCAAPDSQSH